MAAPTPADIHPESGCRLPLPRRADLDAEGQAIFDSFTGANTESLVGLRGPGGVRLHSPRAAALAQPITRYLRFEALPPRLRELAILVTAREHDSRFEWAAHEPQALNDGVPQAVIDVIKHRKGLDGLAAEDAEVIQLGRELFGEHRVRSETFAGILARHGARATVDLVALMGNYAATAALLAAVDQQVPAGRPLLPVPWDER